MKMSKRSGLRSLIVSTVLFFSASCMQETTDTSGVPIPTSGFSSNEVAQQKDGYVLYSGQVPATEFLYRITEKNNGVGASIAPAELVSCVGAVGGDCQRRSVAGASVRCTKDAVTDVTACFIEISPQEAVIFDAESPHSYTNYVRSGSLLMQVDKSLDATSACVVGHDFPGKRAAIRFGSKQHVSTATTGCVTGGNAKRVEQQARSAQLLTTRRVEWPYESSKDTVARVDGLYVAAESLLKHMIANKMGPL
jgi:hypothetical protein